MELVGGLGNQLFGFTAGLYLATRLGASLRPVLRKPLRGETDHSSSIESILPLSYKLSEMSYKEKIVLELRKMVRKVSLKIGFPVTWVEDFTKVHVSPTLGFDSSLGQLETGSYVFGYFQTYRFLHALKESGAMPPLAPRNPSKWFVQESDLIQKIKPIAVHVRRGDYLDAKNSFIGALAADYYSRAITSLREQLGDNSQGREVWIFSDEPNMVRAEFKNLGLFQEARFVVPPPTAQAGESLFLMSQAIALVISNSTFSWWSAALSDTDAVVAPIKWFKNANDPEDLIPTTWTRLSSSWIS